MPINHNQKKTILLVEDNPDLGEFLCHMFSKYYRVLFAENGVKGLAIATQDMPDIIVSDIMMPQMDGIEMLEQLQKHPLTCHIPVILLTAKNDQPTKLQSLQAQALDFISKPFDQSELQLKVHNWINWREQLATTYKLDKENGHKGLGKQDQAFIEKLDQLLEKHFAEHALEVDFLAKQLAVSSRQLQRKLKSLTGQSPIEYLRSYRIEQGKRLLEQGLQVSLVAEQVGFTTSSYFAKVFKAKYGQSPKLYQQSLSGNPQ